MEVQSLLSLASARPAHLVSRRFRRELLGIMRARRGARLRRLHLADTGVYKKIRIYWEIIFFPLQVGGESA